MSEISGKAPIKKLSAWILMVCLNQKKVLVCQRAKIANNAGQWGLLGGGGDDTETPAQAAAREAFEEGGLRISPNKLKPITVIKGLNSYKNYYFRFDVPFPIQPKLNEEHRQAKWVDYDTLKKMPLHKSIKPLVKYVAKIFTPPKPLLKKTKDGTYKMKKVSASTEPEIVIKPILGTSRTEILLMADNREIGNVLISSATKRVYNLHIDEAYRGQGYSRKLMEAVMALDNHPIKITARPSSTSALSKHQLVQFYSKFGFKPVSATFNSVEMEWSQ